jgi:hypothetical protein
VNPLAQPQWPILRPHAWPGPHAPAPAETRPTVVSRIAARPFHLLLLAWRGTAIRIAKALAALEPLRPSWPPSTVGLIRRDCLFIPFLTRFGSGAGVVVLCLDGCHWQREPQCHDCE